MIPATSYEKLQKGEILLFTPTREDGVLGRLLYAFTRRNFLYDTKGNITDEWVLVPFRCGFEPLEPVKSSFWNVNVDSIHLSVGKFSISRP